MVFSMTAFERRERQAEWGKLIWELRSVNHRYLDLHLRLPDELRYLESAVREHVGGRLVRGKVECTLRFAAAPGVSGTLEINWPFAEQVLAATSALAGRLPSPAAVSPLELLRTPGVLSETPPDMEPVAQAAMELLADALSGLRWARGREGGRLADIVLARAQRLAHLTDQVSVRRGEVNAGIRQKLLARVSEMGLSVDPGRLEQELVLLAQRLDVDEELERLRTHIAEVRRVLTQDEPIGRRLDFLMQELNREANTLTSKSADTETTQAAVEMKVLIEQMREQIQNIE